MRVRLLDDALVDQIAAGEVIERPASVVKELVENSLDAGTTILKIRLEDGVRSRIQVIDNGCGMDESDAMMCLERHATSKIRSLDDLISVRSLGFRGEAIPSIASVSRFELVTRPEGTEKATRLVVEGGTLRSVGEAGAPVGTRITVRNLFFNIPVRRNFLRTTPTELGHCVDAVAREILTRPEVDVVVTHGGREVLRAAKASTLRERARAVLGKAVDDLRDFALEEEGIRVSGLVSPVGIHHGSGRMLHCYVNGRFVRDPLLRRAIREAYQGVLPRGRFPMTILQLELPPHAVDVNVHPTKTEVRFQSPRSVSEILSRGVRESVQRLHQKYFLDREASRPVHRSQPGPALPLPAHPGDDPNFNAKNPRPEPEGPSWMVAEPPPDMPAPAPPPEEVEPPRPPESETHLKSELIAGLAFEERGDIVKVIDGLAVRRATANQAISSGRDAIRLLMPRRVVLPVHLANRLIMWSDVLDEHGIAISDFGGGAVALKRAPKQLVDADLTEWLSDLSAALGAEASDALPSQALHALTAHIRQPYQTLAELKDAWEHLSEEARENCSTDIPTIDFKSRLLKR